MLVADPVVILGREKQCGFFINDGNISRKHAKFEKRDNIFYVEDLGSANGSFLNAIKLEGQQALQNGNVLRFGPFEFEVRIEGSGEAASSERKTPGSQDALTRFKIHIHEILLVRMDLKRMVLGNDPIAFRNLVELGVRDLLKEESANIPAGVDFEMLVKEILDEALGLGPLEEFLADPSVTEIMVNHKDQIYLEKNGKLVLSQKRFINDQQVRAVIERIVAPIGRRIDESTPMVDARLKDGSRVNAIIPPLALKGPSITIRKFSKKPFVIEDLIRFGALTETMAMFLKIAVKFRQNIVISGGTGSGKTTLLNVVSSFIPQDERIVTVEDAAELKLPQDHVVSLETRPPNIEGTGAITIRDLVRNCLRMRPDRIVVGECRGAEALDMLQAMNTGHDGSLTTGHANTPRDMLSRLETMVLMAGMDLPSRAIREQIASAVSLIVQQSRFSDGSRRITHITEITGMEEQTITMQDIFLFKQTGIDPDGKVLGAFTPTGCIPKFMEDLRSRGVTVPLEIFETGKKL
jgi:pilus assembly protein CpaF